MIIAYAAGALFLAAILLALPIFFEREVLESRQSSLTFKLKMTQHIYQNKAFGSDSFSDLLLHKNRWDPGTHNVGKRIRSIRALTGRAQKNQIHAIELCGELILDLIKEGNIELYEEPAKQVLSASDILEHINENIETKIQSKNTKETAQGTKKDDQTSSALLHDANLRDRLERNRENIDIEQIVEILLAAIELLNYRARDPQRA